MGHYSEFARNQVTSVNTFRRPGLGVLRHYRPLNNRKWQRPGQVVFVSCGDWPLCDMVTWDPANLDRVGHLLVGLVWKRFRSRCPVGWNDALTLPLPDDLVDWMCRTEPDPLPIFEPGQNRRVIPSFVQGVESYIHLGAKKATPGSCLKVALGLSASFMCPKR